MGSWRVAPQDFRGLIVLCIAVSGIILLGNVVLLAVASRFPSTDVGTRQLFQGDCDYASSRSTIAHLAINALATALLASSNVAMQCLAAPTREDLDRVHAQGSWLDIGVPSLRNLRYITGHRRIAWIALLITSLPLHLVYNAIFIQSSQASAYNSLVVSQDFPYGASTTNPQLLQDYGDIGGIPESVIKQIQSEASTYTYMSWDECQDTYAQPFVRDWTNLVMVSNVSKAVDGPTNGSSLFTSFWSSPSLESLANNFFLSTAKEVMLECYPDSNALEVQIEKNGSSLNSQQWTWFRPPDQQSLPVPNVTIDHCLAEPAPALCTIELFEPFLGIIIGAIALKMICFTSILFALPALTPLVTFGDAIASFLARPDPVTAGGYAISHTRVEASRRQFKRSTKAHGTMFGHEKEFRDRWYTPRVSWFRIPSMPWLNAASKLHQIIAECCCLGVLIGGAFLVIESAPPATFSNDSPTPTVQQLGLGKLYPQQIFTSTLGWSVWQCLLLANTPQLLLSFVYLAYNQYFTLMIVAAELFSFSTQRQYLRVSRPHGQQRSSYWLGLPFAWSVPLAVLSVGIHWALSQSLFMAFVRITVPAQSPGPEPTMNVIAYSYLGVASLYAMGGLMVITLLVVGVIGRFSYQSPLLSSNSIALSAACHGHYAPPTDGGNAAIEKSGDPAAADCALKYGVTAVTGEKRGRVGFSTEDVQPLETGWVYGRTEDSEEKSGSATTPPPPASALYPISETPKLDTPSPPAGHGGRFHHTPYQPFSPAPQAEYIQPVNRVEYPAVRVWGFGSSHAPTYTRVPDGDVNSDAEIVHRYA